MAIETSWEVRAGDTISVELGNPSGAPQTLTGAELDLEIREVAAVASRIPQPSVQELLWHTDTDAEYLYLLDPDTGAVLASTDAVAADVRDMARDPDGLHMWMVSTFSDQAYKILMSNLTVVNSWFVPASGGAPGGAQPGGIAVDQDGTVWISDTTTDLVYQCAAADGTVLKSFATPSINPAGLAIDGDNRLWLGDRGLNAVQRISKVDGNVEGSIIVTENPWGLAFDADGFLWVADSTGDTISLYDVSDNSVIRSFAAPHTEAGGISPGPAWNLAPLSVLGFASNTGNGAFAVSKPASVAGGHLMLGIFGGSKNTGAPEVTPPAGWTLLGEIRSSAAADAGVLQVWSKRATSAEPTSYTWDRISSACACIIIDVGVADPAQFDFVGVDKIGEAVTSVAIPAIPEGHDLYIHAAFKATTADGFFITGDTTVTFVQSSSAGSRELEVFTAPDGSAATLEFDVGGGDASTQVIGFGISGVS